MSVTASSEDDSTNFGGGLNYGFLSVFTVVIIDLSKVAKYFCFRCAERERTGNYPEVANRSGIAQRIRF